MERDEHTEHERIPNQDAIDVAPSDATTPSIGATEDQMNRGGTTAQITDMGLDALGRDEPDQPDFGRGEPTTPGSGQTGSGAMLNSSREPDEADDFTSRSRQMQAPADAGASRESGGPGYNSSGAQGDGRGGMVNSDGAGEAAGSGPIGGVGGRGDTPDAVGARRAHGSLAPNAPGAESIGINSRADNVDVGSASRSGEPQAVTSPTAPTDDELDRVRGRGAEIYGDVLGGAGASQTRSGDDVLPARSGTADALGAPESTVTDGQRVAGARPQADAPDGGTTGEGRDQHV